MARIIAIYMQLSGLVWSGLWFDRCHRHRRRRRCRLITQTDLILTPLVYQCCRCVQLCPLSTGLVCPRSLSIGGTGFALRRILCECSNLSSRQRASLIIPITIIITLSVTHTHTHT